jgi:arginine decarboxylase-like protein
MTNNLENIDQKLQGDFDFEEPTIGHFDRFQLRLEKETNTKRPFFKKPTKTFFRTIAVAASFVLIFAVVFAKNNADKGVELADVSPKMEETQTYFASVIREEIKKVSKVKTEKNSKIIDDAFARLNTLEDNYKELTFDLKENNNNKQIIFAMINNFQQRIEVLENLLNDLDDFKELTHVQATL